jgi:uncharacterized protein YdhG (YjbR/CyaY superfamily)
MGRPADRPLQLLVGVRRCLAGAEGGRPKGEQQMTDNKRFTTIDDYIATFPGEIQAVLEHVRQAIHKAAPEATETMSYGMPTFDLHGKHLVFFAGWKRHLSLYPIPAGDEAFQQELAHYKRARGTIQFPLNKPIPYDFVEHIVTFLISESPEKER